MNLSILFVILIMAIVGSAQSYEAGLAKEMMQVYKNRSDEVSVLSLCCDSVFVPAAGLLNVVDVVWTESVASSFPTNGERMKIVYRFKGKEWRSGFIDRASKFDVIKYNVEKPFGYMSVENGISYSLDSIKFANFLPPKIKNTFHVAGDFNAVWSRLIEALAEAQIPIITLEKDSGIIATGPVSDPIGSTMICPTALENRGIIKFNIFSRADGDSTKVVINSTFTAQRQNELVTCYSNGSIEDWLISKIR
jgi:hypothetical protein